MKVLTAIMQAHLDMRVRQIVRECVMGDVDKEALSELLRQAAECDWDAGYDSALDEHRVATAGSRQNPWIPR